MRRAGLIVIFATLLVGCGGGETVSPTGEVEGTLPKAAAGNPAQGKALFTSQGCGGCHALKAAGTKGAIGPNLDQSLKGKDEAYIRESIVDPNAKLASGFQPGIMPNYGEQLDSKQVADLVVFLSKQQS
ncbi:MAG: cytochrome c [Actinobacteria bacterium]|nr:cytochrome c [Actinomycetota bacterium]